MAKARKDKILTKGDKPQRNKICKQFKLFAFVIMGFIRYYVDVLIDKIFALYYDRKIRPIKSAENPLVLESATSLAKKIRLRQVKSEEVVKAFIQRIKDVNPLLNAVVDERFNAAIKEAQEIDHDIATGTILDHDFQLKPFLGVPFTSKESTACKGLSYTFGLVNRKKRKALFDAQVVKQMKEAGAILIAVTNVPQLNMWQETSNPVYGTTNNPYNITRNVGGSSGGESSIIAAGGSPLGIGTDIGGSLRIPAFMCGIYGHKPTSNLISTNGLTFRTGDEIDTMVVAGPMCKYAEDLVPFFKVLLGDNVTKLQLDKKVNVKDLRVFYIENPQDPFISPFRDEMKRLFRSVVNHFEDVLPKKPEMLELVDLKYGGKLWRYWMTQEPNANFNRDLANREGEVNTFMEIFRYCLRLSQYNTAVIFNLINNNIFPKEKRDWAVERTKLLRFKLISALGDDGVLLYPSAPWPASYHHSALLRPWNFNLFSVWNALKLPVTQVPLGLSEDGLPVGIQVVAAPHQDHLAIAVAKELERVFGGYVPPFRVEE